MRRVTTFIVMLYLFCVGSFAYADSQTHLEKQRQTFQLAKKALQTNQLTLFQSFKEKLEDYPLSGYLDYLYLRHRLHHVSPDIIHTFLTEEKNTFYAERLRTVWLQRLAKEKNWAQYKSFYLPGSSAELNCNYAHALIKTGQYQQAVDDIISLWLVSHSQDQACDPVFTYATEKGLINDDMIKQRIMLALRNNQYSLATYLAKTIKSDHEMLDWINRWRSIHDSPLNLLNQLPTNPPADPKQVSLARDIDLSREIIIHGIERLARQNTALAFQIWFRVKDSYEFTQQQQRDIRKEIGTRAALSREHEALKYFGDNPGGEWHARAALWQKNWQVTQQTILNMPIQEKSSPQWQYWLARAQSELGQQAQAREIYTRLLNERDFYSFLAADQLDQSYQMNDRPILFSAEELATFKQDPAIQRLHEFYVQDMLLEARREAYYQRNNRSQRELQLMSIITHDWGWHNMTIAILGSAKYWDALDLRFPILFDQEIHTASKKNGLDPSWLLAIARQESAFNPKARSHVGAMGLMQLMPSTGKLISKLINKPIKQVSELYDSQRNIELGSAYLRKVYDENQHNPVLATAAYNAGPHRVSKWLPEQTLPADIWTENIPFNETRHYVKSVMSYAAIFDSQRNQKITPLEDRMPAVQAKKP